MIAILCVGLASIIATMGVWFDWVRLAGAAYLVWLGFKLLRAPGARDAPRSAPLPPRSGFFLQGLLVILSNPKALLFFGALIPQFERQCRLPGRAAGRNLHGGCDALRRRLCGAGREVGAGALRPRRSPGLSPERRSHDGRRGLAGAGARPLSETPPR